MTGPFRSGSPLKPPLVGYASRLPNENLEINHQPPNRGNSETINENAGRAAKSEIRNSKFEIENELVLEHAPLVIDTRGIYRDRNGKVHPA